MTDLKFPREEGLPSPADSVRCRLVSATIFEWHGPTVGCQEWKCVLEMGRKSYNTDRIEILLPLLPMLSSIPCALPCSPRYSLASQAAAAHSDTCLVTTHPKGSRPPVHMTGTASHNSLGSSLPVAPKSRAYSTRTSPFKQSLTSRSHVEEVPTWQFFTAFLTNSPRSKPKIPVYGDSLYQG